MGAITAVGAADKNDLQRGREDLAPADANVLSMCESCVRHINQKELRIDGKLRNSPVMQVCEKISKMSGPKLQSLIRKLLRSPKIRIDKLRLLSEMCEGDDSDLCKAVRDVTRDPAGEEYIAQLTADDIRECAEEVSMAHRNMKFPAPKDRWMSSDDFDWGSVDEVESRVSMYRKN